MAPLDMNFSTAVVLLILAVLVVLAVRRMIGRGLCDSGGSCDGCHDGAHDGGCPTCSAVDKMVADMERAAKGK